MKIATQVCILILLLIAVIVFGGVVQGRNMWMWIAGYWAVLSVKNYLDWRNARKEGTHENSRTKP